MKIGIIGCSHSSGLYTQKHLYRDQGYPIYLATKYPQHEFYNMSTEGTGYTLQSISLNLAQELELDCVIVQLTDARLSLPFNHTLEKISQLSTSEAFRRRDYLDNYRLIQIKRQIQGTVSTESERILHINALQYYQVKNWSFGVDSFNCFKTVALNGQFAELVTEKNHIDLDNFKYWHLNLVSIYSKIFKHLFILDYPPQYHKHSMFKELAVYSWNQSVFDWFIDVLQKEYKLDTHKQAVALANKLTEPLGGHLPLKYQKKVVDEYLISNSKLKSLLESNE